MKLVLSGFYDNKLLLRHMFIFLIATLLSFMNSVRLGLVMIRLVSSAERTNLSLILLSILFAIYCRSLMLSKKSNGLRIQPWRNPCFITHPTIREQIVTFLIMQCSLLSCYPIPFRPKRLSQHPTLTPSAYLTYLITINALFFNLYPANAPDPFKSASYERTKWVRCSHLNAPHNHV